MFIFEKKQKKFKIGKVQIGGQPGELPTVLAGTIFYKKHKIVKDSNKGLFDRTGAETLINKQDELSEITGNPSIVHIFSESKDAFESYIDFVASVTDSPMILDSTDADARIHAVKYCQEVGLSERAIYNSIYISVNDEEVTSIRESGVESAIVLAFNPKSSAVDEKIEVLESGGGFVDKGLLKIAEEAGIKKPLLDTAMTPLGSGAGNSVRLTSVSYTHLTLPTN